MVALKNVVVYTCISACVQKTCVDILWRWPVLAMRLYAGAAIKHQTLYIAQRMKNVIPLKIFFSFEVADLFVFTC